MLPEPDEPLLLTLPEVAKLLGIGRNMAYELAHAGRLRTVTVGRRILVPVDEPAAFVERETQGAA